MKLTHRRSWTTWTMSPARRARSAAQWRTVPPAEWPPRRISVRPSPSARGELGPAGDADEMQLGAPQPDHAPQQPPAPLPPFSLLAVPPLVLLDHRERPLLQLVDLGLRRAAFGSVTRTHLDPPLA